MKLTPRQMLMNVLNGEIPEQTPFTIYVELLPQSAIERNLRNAGLCLIKRTTSYKEITPNVKYEEHRFTNNDGRFVTKHILGTPYGELTMLTESAGFTNWTHEYMFKSPEDYKKILFVIEDTRYEEDYARAMNLQNALGEDFAIRDQLPLEPMQVLQSGSYFGTETFCIEWMDNRDEMLKLYNALVNKNRQVYQLAANGPLSLVNYGGNVMPNVIGGNMFEEYYIPHYNEAAELLHTKGKIIGTHLDSDNTIIMDLIAKTKLDYIEAYDPGMSPSVAEARRIWPDKSLWINWPASWHLYDTAEVYSSTCKLIEEAKPGNNFIIGITENVPEDRDMANYQTIMNAILDS